MSLTNLAAACVLVVLAGCRAPARTAPAPAATAGSDAADVDKRVGSKTTHLKPCYDEALRRDATTAGRVEVKWVIEGGRVTQAETTSNSTGDAKLAACVERRIMKWRFDPADDGTVEWPFVFRQR